MMHIERYVGLPFFKAPIGRPRRSGVVLTHVLAPLQPFARDRYLLQQCHRAAYTEGIFGNLDRTSPAA